MNDSQATNLASWRSVEDDLPDWKDPFSGEIEVKDEDGVIVSGYLDYDVPTPDDFPELLLTTGGQLDSIHDYVWWRPV